MIVTKGGFDEPERIADSLAAKHGASSVDPVGKGEERLHRKWGRTIKGSFPEKFGSRSARVTEETSTRGVNVTAYSSIRSQAGEALCNLEVNLALKGDGELMQGCQAKQSVAWRSMA